MSKSIESISKGLDISMKNPILLVPYAVPIVVQWIFSALAHLFPLRYYFIEEPNPLILMLGSFVAAILGFIAACMLIDMVNDALNGQPINLSKSLNITINRIGTLILTAVIAALCGLTVILLPIAIFIIVVAVIENVGVVESAKKTFNFVLSNLGEVIIFIILVIIIGAVLPYVFSLIPIIGSYVGAIVSWLLNAIFTISAVYFYILLSPPPPPPPPLPPPQV